MNDALIGYSGFVGSLLLKQRAFQHRFRSISVAGVAGHHFNTVVCSAAPAQKWKANREPEADRANIQNLCSHLGHLHTDSFILISTVDVFMNPVNVDEDSPVETAGLHPYGLHRYELEQFVRATFPNALIVRLPGLVGPGLRKNIIYDFHNANALDAVDHRSIFQFYPMVNLWYDIEIAQRLGHRLVHLTAEPLRVSDVASAGFGVEFCNALDRPPAVYDFRSLYAHDFGPHAAYQYSRRETIGAIRAFAQSEPTLEGSARQPGGSVTGVIGS